MKILVLGASGMAGHTIALYFKESGHEVTAFDKNIVNICDYIQGDATDFNNLKSIVLNGNYDCIINAIGILNEFAEKNKPLSILINSYLPHFLTEITQNIKTKVIQMSTDCVFSGKLGNYTENSLRDGDTFYDRTKALGEIDNKKDLTFRQSIVGPDINESGIGLFNWFMKKNGSINGYRNAIWTGVTTLTLAKAMEIAIKENLVGIYNLVNNEPISKFDLLKVFNKYIRNDKLKIIPDDKIIVNKSLLNSRSDFSYIVPSYDEMIIEMEKWIIKHKDLYPHYFKGEELL